MKTTTETVVRKHIKAFVESQGVPAILADYDDGARFHSESRTYRGKAEIGEFFTGFIASLPPGTTDRFQLKTLRVDGDVAYITWSAGSDFPLGTDTFVVKDGLIVQQTFTMYVPPK